MLCQPVRTIPDFIGAFKIWAAPSKAQKLLGVTGTPSSRNSHDAIHQIQVGFLHLAVGIGGLEGQGLAAAVPRLGIFGAREGMGRAPSPSSLQAKSPACSPFDSYFDFLFSILISYFLFISIHPPQSPLIFFDLCCSPLSPRLSPSSPNSFLPEQARTCRSQQSFLHTCPAGTASCQPCPCPASSCKHLGNIWACPTGPR